MRAWALLSDLRPYRRRWIALLALALHPWPGHAAEPRFLPEVAPLSEFPDAGSATRREGVFLPPQAPRLLTPGMTKRQVYALLGVPHFHEGLLGERRWNYILDFYTGQGTEYRIRRLQLRWDRRMRLERIAWSDASCRDMVYPPAQPLAAAGPLPSPVTAVRPRTLTVYFDFDKAALSEEAQRDLAAFMTEAGPDGGMLSVTGFTDSAGPDAYNDRLSLMRADNVARRLVAMGVPLSKLQISGAGERSPARSSDGPAKEPLNRRVLLEWTVGAG